MKARVASTIILSLLVIVALTPIFGSCLIEALQETRHAEVDYPLASASMPALAQVVPVPNTFVTVMESNTTEWDTDGIMYPFVLYDGGLYKMWYTACCNMEYWPPYHPCRWAIAYAESNDGVVWSNKQRVHDTGSTSYFQTGNPCVLKENGTYRMWHMDYYEWVGADWSSYISHMNSSDGKNWPGFMSTGDEKVLSAQGQSTPQGDGLNVWHASVIHEPSGYVMWYTVYDYPAPGTVGPTKVWRATSSDGKSWSERQLSLPYITDTWEDEVGPTCVVKEDDGTYTMFYAADYANDTASIGTAKSVDGITWNNRQQLLKSSDLGVNISLASTWTAGLHHFKDIDGKRYLYFTYYDNSDGKLKFGRIELAVVDWWPMFHHDFRHTGYSTSKAPNTNQILWSTPMEVVCSSPAVADGKVYIGSIDSNVYCLDAETGAHIWNYTTGGGVCSSPAVVDDKVYVGSCDSNVYCLDASTGTLIWNYATGDIVESSPAVVDDRVYVGSWDCKVYCLNASTGAFIWNYTTGHCVESSPAVVDDRVYVGSDDCNVYALNATTGELIWSYTTGGTVLSSPAVADGKVYVGSGDNKVYCLNASRGALKWNYTTGGFVMSSPAVAYGKVYIGSDDRKVYCLNASTGALKWNYTTGGKVWSSPAVADGKVYILSSGGIYALNASTGALIWSYYPASTLGTDSPAVADRKVFIVSMGGGMMSACIAFADHDVAVTNVTPSKTVVGQGYTIRINATIQNQGHYEETSNVTVYANTTIIDTLTNITLSSGNFTTIAFTWKTTGFAKGNYTIWAYAWPLPTETDTLDNTKTADSEVKIGVPGDLNGDNLCDLLDLVKVAGKFGKVLGEPGYDPNYDINNDNIIDLLDLVKVAIHFGETDP